MCVARQDAECRSLLFGRRREKVERRSAGEEVMVG